MAYQTAVLAVLPRPALNRFRQVCSALAPETDSHYYWQDSKEWRATRRAAARDCLQAVLG